MIPTLALMSGATVFRIGELIGSRRWATLVGSALLALAGFGFAKLPLLSSDPSNDWNKVGGVLRIMERFDEAEEALLRAEATNPRNPNTYRNLSVLYRQTGRMEEAVAAEVRAQEVAAEAEEARSGFVESLRESGRQPTPRPEPPPVPEDRLR
jgi:tetratricopeptide (TPR) repeat protein